MPNPTEAAMIRRLDLKRRVSAEAEERLERATKRLATAKRTWQELCRGKRVYDISLFQAAAENLILAHETYLSAADVAKVVREHNTNAEAE